MNLETRIRSTAMRRLSSPGFQRFQQRRGQLVRRLRGGAPTVHYFHQVDDPYSHLAVQKLDALADAYDVTFIPHLVSKPDAPYLGSADHFDHWALNDAISVAHAYGTTLPSSARAPEPANIAQANAILAAHMTQSDFAECARTVGEALWSGTPLEGTCEDAAGSAAVAEGNQLRRRLGHYLGGMFHYDGEWFWGVDRLRLLEQRLRDENMAKGPNLVCPEPTPTNTTGLNAEHVLLEYFPSLRSPYTAIGHQRVLDLIERSGVSVQLRPVMPMLMRGVPAPTAKQRYIITDAGREGRAHGSPLRKIVDPFGDPVKRAFALFPGAVALGRGMNFVTAYLEASWVDGVDITTEAGLRQVADRAGLDWTELERASADADWEAVLDENLQAMLGAGLWGVPSFRLSGGSIEQPLACWGQDRIWRVEDEIAARV